MRVYPQPPKPNSKTTGTKKKKMPRDRQKKKAAPVKEKEERRLRKQREQRGMSKRSLPLRCRGEGNDVFCEKERGCHFKRYVVRLTVFSGRSLRESRPSKAADGKRKTCHKKGRLSKKEAFRSESWPRISCVLPRRRRLKGCGKWVENRAGGVAQVYLTYQKSLFLNGGGLYRKAAKRLEGRNAELGGKGERIRRRRKDLLMAAKGTILLLESGEASGSRAERGKKIKKRFRVRSRKGAPEVGERFDVRQADHEVYRGKSQGKTQEKWRKRSIQGKGESCPVDKKGQRPSSKERSPTRRATATG